MKFRNSFAILVTLGAIILVPYCGAFIRWGGKFPDEYFTFPPTKPSILEPNLMGVIITSVFFVLAVILYFFPKLFGFRKTEITAKLTIHFEKLPIWFWIGFIIWVVSLIAFAAKLSEPKWFTNWAFIPLCWGFILLLDGIVYSINYRESLISSHLKELVAMAVASISGWLIYEYLNFFIQHNWYYPAAGLISGKSYYLYAIIGSSAFIPMAFEWFQLLSKIKLLQYRYAYGPKITFSKKTDLILLTLSFVILFIIPFFPESLFYMIWIIPIVVISIVLKILDIQTPFSSIKEKGDWTFLLVFALTWLAQGFLIESWNYSSGYIVCNEHLSNNPAYWRYCIPYVSVLPIFEMPFLGYMGYLLFSIHCWLWWTVISKVFFPNLNLNFSLGDEFL